MTMATERTFETPHYVTAGLGILDALYADRFEGSADLYSRTSNLGGEPIVNSVFEMRPYCWCDGQRAEHSNGCPPNFVHHESGFAASWYKHAERGARCSIDLSAAQWAALLRECIEVLLEAPPVYRVLITGSREFGAGLRVPGSKSRFRPNWATASSPQRDAMVAALRGARERAGNRPMLVVHGAAAGADTLSGLLAERAGVATEEWPALWRREDGSLRGGYDRAEALRVRAVYAPGKGYYPKAGPERNRAMVAAGADECLAFLAVGAKNSGTRDCMKVVTTAGIPLAVTEA